MDAARGRHARWQESHMLVAAICVAIVADLVGRQRRSRGCGPDCRGCGAGFESAQL
jgi:hypothetical protein